MLDFEANCVHNPGRDPDYVPAPGDYTGPLKSFVPEIIEFPTVIFAKVPGKAAGTGSSGAVSGAGKKPSRWRHRSSGEVDQPDPPQPPILSPEVGENEAGVEGGPPAPAAPSYSWQPIAEFRELCLTELHPITPFCTQLTGIERSDVEESGKPFSEVWQRWHRFMAQYPNSLIVTCGDWDLRTMLPKQLKLSGLENQAPRTPAYWCNIKHCYEELYGQKAGGMAKILKSLRLELVGKHHSGIDDCRNIGRAAVKMLEDGRLKRGGGETQEAGVTAADREVFKPTAFAKDGAAGGGAGKRKKKGG